MSNLCVYAWKGLQITPEGDLNMCCFQNGEAKLGNIKTENKTISQIRREPIWNEIRQSMLDGKQHPACKKCWDQENAGFYSGRNYINDKYPESLLNISSSELQDDELHHMDVRQSNICNMKCLSCNGSFSSLWRIEESKEWGSVKNNGVVEISNDDIYNTIFSNIKNIKEFYFAGGEPLINKIHWDIMEELDRQKRYDVRIVYNTNLLKLDYKGKHIFDYWDKFNNWHAGISIDAIGNRAEYVRHGTVWSKISENLNLIQSRYPKNFSIDCTLSALNVSGLIDLFEFIEFSGINNYRWNNYVFYPRKLHVSILPKFYREKLVSEIKKYFENSTLNHYTLIGEDCLSYFEEQMLNNELASEDDKAEFKKFILYKDRERKTDIFKSCPEFIDMWNII